MGYNVVVVSAIHQHKSVIITYIPPSITPLWDIIGEFSKVAGYKINTEKTHALLYNNDENQKEK